MNTFQFLADHGASVLFWVIFVEQIGFPIPAIPLLIAAGALVGAGKMSLAMALLVPVAAALPPDLAWYYLGRIKGGKVLGFLCRLSLEPDSCVRDTENLFHRYGPRGLLLAKFIPGFNTVAPPLAGIVGMAATTFALYDVAGTLIWAAVSAGVGALFSNQLEQLVGVLDQAGGLVFGVLLIGLAGFIGYKFYGSMQIGVGKVSSFPRQEGGQNLESHILLVPVAVGAPLNHANLVIQAFDEAELDLVAGHAIRRDARPVPFD